jgi:hypothetical protein
MLYRIEMHLIHVGGSRALRQRIDITDLAEWLFRVGYRLKDGGYAISAVTVLAKMAEGAALFRPTIQWLRRIQRLGARVKEVLRRFFQTCPQQARAEKRSAYKSVLLWGNISRDESSFETFDAWHPASIAQASSDLLKIPAKPAPAQLGGDAKARAARALHRPISDEAAP